MTLSTPERHGFHTRRLLCFITVRTQTHHPSFSSLHIVLIFLKGGCKPYYKVASCQHATESFVEESNDQKSSFLTILILSDLHKPTLEQNVTFDPLNLSEQSEVEYKI